YCFLGNEPVSKYDQLGLYSVPQCTVEVLVGHNRATAPNIPAPILTAPSSAASVVACSGGEIDVPIKIPGIDPRPDGTINLAEAGRLARSDFDFGKTYAKDTICKKKEWGCKKVSVKINCIGINILERLAMPANVCGK